LPKLLLPSLFREVALLLVVMFTAVPPLVGVAKKILAAGTKFSQTSTAGPLGVLAAYLAAATTKARDFDGGPLRGVVRNSGSGHHRSWRRRWRSPGVLAASLVAATTKVEDVDDGPLGVLAACSAMTTTDAGDIDGEPPRGCWQVRQRPPSKLKTSIVAPLEGARSRSGSGHHRS
jgi:hypothetical protein